MSLLRNTASGLRSLFRREQVDRELDEELRVVAVRKVRLADGSSLGSARINGIATAYSALEEVAPATKIWGTVTGCIPGVKRSNGALLELPAF